MLSLLFTIAITAIGAFGLDNGLARTPPMGWLAWQRFRCITDCETYPDECISEDLFMRTADLMVSDGYKDAGYEYIGIDDCWMEKERDDNGKLVADRKRFPSGIKALADYVHERGLKLGIYEDFGTMTCARYPGSLFHLQQDAETFVEWEVDYVKLDGCFVDTGLMDEGYPAFGQYLNKTGRPILYSCSWPYYQEYEKKQPNYTSIREHCNLWRNYEDIEDAWFSVADIIDWYDKNTERLVEHAGPGHWNDPDMLIIGNYGLSYDQSKAQMAIWAILAAPLLLSTDLKTMKPELKDIVLNKEIIAVNQDSLGIQGRKVFSDTSKIDVWSKQVNPTTDDKQSYAVVFYSRRVDGYAHFKSFNLTDIGLKNPNGYSVMDLYDSDKEVWEITPESTVDVRVIPLGVVMYKFTPL